MSSSSTSATESRSPDFQAFSLSIRCPVSCFSVSRSRAAFSKSCSSIADSLSRRASAIFSSSSRSSGGAVIRRILNRAPASSIRSIALSGRNRSLTYRSARVAAATLADRYVNDRFLPDKAIDLIDEAGARLRIRRMTAPPELRELDEKIAEARRDKESAIDEQDFDLFTDPGDTEKQLT